MYCIYCELPEIRAREITGSRFAWAFPTNIPIVPGHTLIAPRRCVKNYAGLTSLEKFELETLRLVIMDALSKSFGATGFNFAWNEGKFAGQSVPHFHLHVLPRKEGDTGITQYEPRQFLYRPGEREATPEAELLAVSELIRQAL
jgi:bis(5'-adenosyl)-triphosphatase